MMTLFVPEKLEQRIEALSKRLMPLMGPCETLEGEMIRAINRILYRFYNDGDYWWKGYGTETAGSAAAFLMSYDTPMSIRPELRLAMDCSDSATGDVYERALFKAAEIIVDYVESRDEMQENEFDMLEYDPKYEDTEEDDWDDEEWDDEDDEY